jgi:hypothetical protein
MEMELDNYVFLLGGHDLEMVEIRKLLLAEGYSIVDKKLAWGASWIDYADVINNPGNENMVFVGIELSDKENKPGNAIDIDHHNERNDEHSSIEQVAELNKCFNGLFI